MSLLKVKNLHTYFETNLGLIKVLQGINFTIDKGETLGIVGESGSGKSQTALSILKLFQPNQKIHKGEIIFNDQIISKYNEKEMQKIRGNEIAMIFQDAFAGLNPVFKIKNQIMEALFIHRDITNKEAYNITLEILKKVQIIKPKRVMDSYPYQLSGGLCQRVMIAMALVCEPKLLIVDEATTALDVIIQKEILTLIKDLQKENNTSILFITHDLAVVSEVADNIVVMRKGKIIEKALTKEILKKPKHDYTKQLLTSFLKTNF